MFFNEFLIKLFIVIVYYCFLKNLENSLFLELATVPETFLQDTNFMSILSKTSSQASGDSVMYIS